VVHLTPHRIRIKIPRWRRHHDNFAVLQRELESRPGVVCVRVNPWAASIVIHCGDGFEIASVRIASPALSSSLQLAVYPVGRVKSPPLNGFAMIHRACVSPASSSGSSSPSRPGDLQPRLGS
jgi:hypothetical protein